MKKIKITIFSLLLAFLFLFAGCAGPEGGSGTIPPQQGGNSDGDENNPGGDVENPGEGGGENNPGEGGGEEDVKERQMMIADANFTSGFTVTRTGTSGDFIVGSLDNTLGILKSQTLNTRWRVGQWGCRYSLIEDGTFSKVGNYSVFKDSGKELRVNTVNGRTILEVNGEAEYPSRARQAGEEWTHLILDQEPMKTYPLISEIDELWMECEFILTKFENKMTSFGAQKFDPNLHTAQLQWIVTLQDRTTPGAGGEYAWVNIPFFDARWTSLPSDNAYMIDGGKESATGRPIYAPAANRYLSKVPVVGEKMTVRLNLVPIFKEAYNKAKQEQAEGGTNRFPTAIFEKMTLGAMNIGWEVPGTYNVTADILKMQLYYYDKK